jgi:hypothetical protein
MSQQGTAASQPLIEAAHDATGTPSQRKSSVASTDLPEDDDESAIRYPVDDITGSTSCELHVKVVNITMKVVVGYALPIGPDATYHCCPIPHGYAVAGVDEVMGGFEQLKLDHPAGERDLYELGEAKKTTVLWLKEYIVLPNWTPSLQRVTLLHRHGSLLRHLRVILLQHLRRISLLQYTSLLQLVSRLRHLRPLRLRAKSGSVPSLLHR